MSGAAEQFAPPVLSSGSPVLLRSDLLAIADMVPGRVAGFGPGLW